MGNVKPKTKEAAAPSAGATSSEDSLTDPLASAGAPASTVASRVYGGGSSRGGGAGSRFDSGSLGSFGGGTSRGGGAGSRSSDEAG
jgi:hypothetical protein